MKASFPNFWRAAERFIINKPPLGAQGEAFYVVILANVRERSFGFLQKETKRTKACLLGSDWVQNLKRDIFAFSFCLICSG